MIIMEGTDKAGKSTFLANLIRHFPQERRKELNVVHFGILPDDWDYCEDYLQYIDDNVILDRFVDSELAYGPVYRGGPNPRLTEESLSRVYRRCAELGALTIYCNPDIDAVLSRIEDQGDQMIKRKEQLVALRERFDSIFGPSYPLGLEMVDTTKPIKDDVYKGIVQKSLVLERSAKQLRNTGIRGFYTPWSEYIVYTSHPVHTMHYILRKAFPEIASSKFAIVRNRNIENKPVNIQSLAYGLVTKGVFVLEEQSIRDYEEAENKNAATNCRGISELLISIKQSISKN